MTDLDKKLKQEFLSLPEEYYEQAWNFIQYLKWKYEREKGQEINANPAFGCGDVKGSISPDFDEPLEDFKEYME